MAYILELFLPSKMNLQGDQKIFKMRKKFVFNEETNMIRCVCVHTDISRLKNNTNSRKRQKALEWRK